MHRNPWLQERGSPNTDPAKKQCATYALIITRVLFIYMHTTRRTGPMTRKQVNTFWFPFSLLDCDEFLILYNDA